MRRRLETALLACAALLPALAVAAPQEPPEPDAGQPVIGISLRGAHRAYSLSLFAQRRVVNDVVGSMEVAVFHDPQDGTTTAWFRTVFGEPIEFSGSAAGTVADDLTTVTRWDLTTGVAVDGNLQGQRLVRLPVTKTSWGGWTALHPETALYGPPSP